MRLSKPLTYRMAQTSAGRVSNRTSIFSQRAALQCLPRPSPSEGHDAQRVSPSIVLTALLASRMRFDPVGNVREQRSDRNCGKLHPPKCFADTALVGGDCASKKAFQTISSCLSRSGTMEQRRRRGQATVDRESAIGAQVQFPGYPGARRLIDDAHVHIEYGRSVDQSNGGLTAGSGTANA